MKKEPLSHLIVFLIEMMELSHRFSSPHFSHHPSSPRSFSFTFHPPSALSPTAFPLPPPINLATVSSHAPLVSSASRLSRFWISSPHFSHHPSSPSSFSFTCHPPSTLSPTGFPLPPPINLATVSSRTPLVSSATWLSRFWISSPHFSHHPSSPPSFSFTFHPSSALSPTAFPLPPPINLATVSSRAPLVSSATWLSRFWISSPHFSHHPSSPPSFSFTFHPPFALSPTAFPLPPPINLATVSSRAPLVSSASRLSHFWISFIQAVGFDGWNCF